MLLAPNGLKGDLVDGLIIFVEICLPKNGVEVEGKFGGGIVKACLLMGVGELLCDGKDGGGTSKVRLLVWKLCTLDGLLEVLTIIEKLILPSILILPSLLHKRVRVSCLSLKLKFSMDKFNISSELCGSLGSLDKMAIASEKTKVGFSKISNNSLVRS